MDLKTKLTQKQNTLKAIEEEMNNLVAEKVRIEGQIEFIEELIAEDADETQDDIEADDCDDELGDLDDEEDDEEDEDEEDDYDDDEEENDVEEACEGPFITQDVEPVCNSDSVPFETPEEMVEVSAPEEITVEKLF